MKEIFSPKFQSQYNVLPGNKQQVNNVETSSYNNHCISFSPSTTIVEKRKVLQQSYETRVNKEKLRSYNG